MNLKEQVAIVTGGSGGIGKEIALSLARAGATVVVNYHSNSTSAFALKSEIEALGGIAKVVQADVSKYADAEMLVEAVMLDFGRVDILVNNAGITRDNLILRMSEEDFDKVLETNLKGAWSMSKLCARHMAKQRSGRIVNITSVSGMIGNPGQTNYSASKAGLIGLTMSLAREFAKRGITCNAVAPGFIETRMTDELPDEVKTRFLETIPLAKFGKPEDVANAVLFLVSSESQYMTGQVLRVDGGLVMG